MVGPLSMLTGLSVSLFRPEALNEASFRQLRGECSLPARYRPGGTRICPQDDCWPALQLCPALQAAGSETEDHQEQDEAGGYEGRQN